MTKLTPELLNELAVVGDKHGLDREYLFWEIYEMMEKIYRIEDIKTRIRENAQCDDWWIDKEDDEDFVNRVYNRYQASYESDYNLWDNIDSALRWIQNGWDK